MIILDFFAACAPLLLASFGATLTEYTGVMAVYIEGIMNLGGFLSFAFAVLFKNPYLGFLASLCIIGIYMYFIAFFIEKSKANPFLIGLGINLLSTGLISVFSQAFFHTRGVVAFNTVLNTTAPYYSVFMTLPGKTKIYGSFSTILVCGLLALIIHITTFGLHIRITNKSPEALKAAGLNPAYYKKISWLICGLLACVSGTFKVFRISSFVPNISSGLGWIALVCVYLGRSNFLGVALATMIFSFAEISGIYLQNLSTFISPTVILALPYLISLLAFIFIPDRYK